MTLEQRDSFAGVMTNVAETKASPNALRIADNVVVRRPGAVEQRQGFIRRIDPVAQAAGKIWLNAIAYNGSVLYEDFNGIAVDVAADDNTLLYDESGTLIAKNSALSPDRFRQDSFASAQLRGNLYLPMAQGLMRYPTGDDQYLYLAGEPVSRVSFYLNVSGTQAGTNLPVASSWSYRLVLRRVDPNGLITRSRPTGAKTIKNVSGATAACHLYIAIGNGGMGAGLRVDEVVEVYRGRAFPNTVQPDDEMALVAELPYGTFTNSFQSCDFADDLPDAQRGAALYTSPSQGGIEAASDCPPAAAFCDVFRGCLFLGNTRGPARKLFSSNYDPSETDIGIATGAGRRDVTLTTTSGSNSATISDATGVQVGMMIASLTVLPHFGQIISISGTTILFSRAVTGAPMGAAITGSEVVSLYDQLFVDTTQLVANPELMPFGVSSTLLHFGAYLITPPEPTYRYTVVIERVERDVVDFLLSATHGDELLPQFPLLGTTGVAFDQDIYPNAIQWSEPDQPENFPIVNYALIGDRHKAILGLCATRDALFIFKEDGIWRLSGYEGEWQIDPFDLTTFCVLPSSIKRLNNRVYMLSNKGVVAIDDVNGVVVVSSVISDQVSRLVDNARANNAAHGYYALDGVPGVAATVDERNSEYLLLTGSTPLDVVANGILVFNDASGAWTTFSFNSVGTNGSGLPPSGLGTAENGDPILLHTGGVRRPTYGRRTVGGVLVSDFYDGSAAYTVTSTVDAGGGYTLLSFGATLFAAVPGIDFVMLSNGNVFPIVDFRINPDSSIYPVIPPQNTPSTSNRVLIDTSQAAFTGNPGDTFTFMRAVTCTVQPHGWCGAIANTKIWNELAIAFSRFLGPNTLQVSWSGSEQLAKESTQALIEPITLIKTNVAGYGYKSSAAYHFGTLFRSLVPIDHARSWLLRMKISWVSLFGNVSLEAIAVDSRLEAIKRPQVNSQ